MKRTGAAEMAGAWRANEALREAEVGNFARARQRAAEALALSDGQSVRILAALALARAGDTAQAQKLAAQLDQEAPGELIVQGYWLPSIAAATELSNHNPDRAITALESAAPYELGSQSPFELGPMYPIYLRGVAFLQVGNAQAAAAEFQEMIDQPGIAGNFVLAALAHLQLARAEATMGNKAAASQAYHNFLTLWKDADPDLPIFQQAKAEQAKLGREKLIRLKTRCRPHLIEWLVTAVRQKGALKPSTSRFELATHAPALRSHDRSPSSEPVGHPVSPISPTPRAPYSLITLSG